MWNNLPFHLSDFFYIRFYLEINFTWVFSFLVNSEASVAGEGQRQVHVTCLSLRILFSIQNSKMLWELVYDSPLVTTASSTVHFTTATQGGCNYFTYEIPCVMFNLSTSRHPEC